MSGDSLGDRMKGYEDAYRISMPRRMPVILRVDGKAFHTLTRHCAKPFDENLMRVMDGVALALCAEVQGAVFAFTQSDEVSVLLHCYKRLNSEAWFQNNLQKIVSVSASIAAVTFANYWSSGRGKVRFDARAFVLPEAEVCNYFVWRQQDATRNSIQMAARAVFSHAECENKNTSELQEMLHSRGVNWNDYPVGCRRGRAVVRVVEPDGWSGWDIDDPPIFSQDRAYVERHLAVEPEA